MRVAIVGGGIGGMTLALSLLDAGIDDVDIYEFSSAVKGPGVCIPTAEFTERSALFRIRSVGS